MSDSSFDMEELNAVEDEEFASAVAELLGLEHFHRFITRWVVEAEELTTGPVPMEGLAQLNFDRGRAVQAMEFMHTLQEVSPSHYLQLTQEKTEYVRRRRAAQQRADESRSEYEPRDGDSGGFGD